MDKKTLTRIALLVATAGIAQATHAAQEVARVISSTPTVQSVLVPQQVCTNQPVVRETRGNSAAGAIFGAIAGGAIGNAIGKGSGRDLATAAGLMGGAILGHELAQKQENSIEHVQQCSTQNHYENRTVGYTVVYEYGGKQYTTQMAHDPGRYMNIEIEPAGAIAAPAVNPASVTVIQQPTYTETAYVDYEHPKRYRAQPIVIYKAQPVIIHQPAPALRPFHSHPQYGTVARPDNYDKRWYQNHRHHDRNAHIWR